MSVSLQCFQIQLTQQEKEAIGTYRQNLAYQPTKDELFILQVAKQSGILSQDTSLKAALKEIEKKKTATRIVSISDMNMSEEKFNVLNKYFPHIYAVKVENARLGNTLICTAAEVQQYFPRFRNVRVLGLESNRAEFFDLVDHAPKK